MTFTIRLCKGYSSPSQIEINGELRTAMQVAEIPAINMRTAKSS